MYITEVFVDEGGREGFSDNRLFRGNTSVQVSVYGFMLTIDHAQMGSYLVARKHLLICFLDKFLILFLEY